jgi:hypothetical protein
VGYWVVYVHSCERALWVNKSRRTQPWAEEVGTPPESSGHLNRAAEVSQCWHCHILINAIMFVRYLTCRTACRTPLLDTIRYLISLSIVDSLLVCYHPRPKLALVAPSEPRRRGPTPGNQRHARRTGGGRAAAVPVLSGAVHGPAPPPMRSPLLLRLPRRRPVPDLQRTILPARRDALADGRERAVQVPRVPAAIVAARGGVRGGALVTRVAAEAVERCGLRRC